MTWNVSNYCGTPLKLWPTYVDGTVPAAAVFVPDVDVKGLTEQSSQQMANRLHRNATKFAILRYALEADFDKYLFKSPKILDPYIWALRKTVYGLEPLFSRTLSISSKTPLRSV